MSGPVGFDVFTESCPSRLTLEHVASRWGSLTMVALLDDTVRFNALRRKVTGISEKMLAQTLHALEDDGFVHRAAQPTIPPRVDYSLTPLGRRVARKVVELIELVESEMPEVLAARERVMPR